MLRTYLPAIVFLLLGTGVGGAFAVLNTLLGPEARGRIKSKADPYECGLPSEVQQGFRFGISFYLVAMLFILFDIEVVFLYPVAVQLRAFGTFALVETIVFIALLLVAFVYVWRQRSARMEIIRREQPATPDDFRIRQLRARDMLRGDLEGAELEQLRRGARSSRRRSTRPSPGRAATRCSRRRSASPAARSR